MKIFILNYSPYDTADELEAQNIFCEGVIEQKGHTPVNPDHLFGEHEPNYGWELRFGASVVWMLQSDAVLVLGNVYMSRESKALFDLAKAFGKKIFTKLKKIKPNENSPKSSR